MSSLDDIEARARRGETPTTTVRELLSWFGVYRRGKHKAVEVRKKLEDRGLRTWPDFGDVYYDGEVEVRLIHPTAAATNSDESGASLSPTARDPSLGSAEAAVDDEGFGADPVPRLAQLAAANRVPVSIGRDETIAVAVTKMLAFGYSQLPVMQGERSVDGFISWQTIGTAQARETAPKFVRDAMNRSVSILKADTPLIDAVHAIVANEFVLVEGVGKKITGIVTTADLSLQFLELAQPYLLIAQIEGRLRTVIDSAFSLSEIQSAKDPNDSSRHVASAADLSFGEYIRLFQKPELWSKLPFKLDRAVVIDRLEQVRTVRNDVMHFEPEQDDSAKAESLSLLLAVARMFESLV